MGTFVFVGSGHVGVSMFIYIIVIKLIILITLVREVRHFSILFTQWQIL